MAKDFCEPAAKEGSSHSFDHQDSFSSEESSVDEDATMIAGPKVY